MISQNMVSHVGGRREPLFIPHPVKIDLLCTTELNQLTSEDKNAYSQRE